MMQVTAAAMGQSALLKNSAHMTRPIISVFAPPSISGITYSPTDGMNTSMEPAMTPGMDKGRVKTRNARHGRAPRSSAASSRRISKLTRSEYKRSSEKRHEGTERDRTYRYRWAARLQQKKE